MSERKIKGGMFQSQQTFTESTIVFGTAFGKYNMAVCARVNLTPKYFTPNQKQ